MKTTTYQNFLLLLFTVLFFSCNKDENNETGAGNNTNPCTEQQSVNGLPGFQWMLEGGKIAYYNWNEDNYYDFGDDWVWASCGSNYKLHTGWDIKIKQGSIVGKEVYSAFDGYIKKKGSFGADSNGNSWAYYITIEHIDNNGNPFTTTYGHINYLNELDENQFINKGQLIGFVADLTENDHLHFTVRRNYYNQNISNKGALPKYINNCYCNNEPVFPEFFVDPALINYLNNTQNNNQPNLEFPSNNSSNNSNPINFNWQNIANSTYRIQVSTNSSGWSAQNGFQSGLVIDLNNDSNSYQWNNASLNTTYYWSVKSIDNNGNSSNYAQPFTFSTTNNSSSAIISLSTSSINFGSVQVGTTSSQQPFTITNTGTSNLSISNITLPNGFNLVNGQSVILNPQSSFTFYVTFSPTSAISYNGQLTVVSNATSGNNIINLSGNGINNTSNISINVSPSSLNFGNVNVGNSSSQNITIHNTGNQPLVVSGVYCANGYYYSNYSGTIPVYSSEQVSVTFNPNSSGTLNSQLIVSSNATSGNNIVNLYGNGVSSTSCNPVGNPTIGYYGSCESVYDYCGYRKGIINAGIASVNCSSHQITFEFKKCDGTAFLNGGTLSVISDICSGSTYGSSVQFYTGEYIHQITITDNNMSGTKTYYLKIVQSTGNSISPPLQITY